MGNGSSLDDLRAIVGRSRQGCQRRGEEREEDHEQDSGGSATHDDDDGFKRNEMRLANENVENHSTRLASSGGRRRRSPA